MDFSQLSDAELEAMVMGPQEQRQPQGGVDFSSMSDEELESLIFGGSMELDVPQETMPTEPEGPSRAQTALESVGKGATLGYLPQLQAMAEPLTDRVFNMIPGGPRAESRPMRQMNPGTQEYVDARDQNIKRQRAQASANPGTALVGEMAGIIGTSVVPARAIGYAGQAVGRGTQALGMGARLGGTGGKILAGAGQGAAFGAMMNPGDVEGEVNPLQLDERMSGAKLGAAFGGGMRAAGAGLQKAAPAMKRGAEQLAFKSSGAMLKEFRKAAPKGEVNKIGRFMLDNKLVKAGDTYEHVARRAQAFNQQAGQKLDQIYKQAVNTSKKGALDLPKRLQNVKPSEFAAMKKGNLGKRWQEMTPKEFSEIRNIGFNPVRDKSKVLSQVRKSLGDDTQARSAINQIDDYLTELGKKHGSKILDPRAANDIKTAIDKAINYSRNPLTRSHGLERAWKSTRSFIGRKVDKHVEKLGSQMGSPGASKALREANKGYGYSRTVMQTAQDRANRVSANNMLGLPEWAVSGGAMAGGLSVGGVPGAVIAPAALRAARAHGTSAAAVGLDKLGNVATRGGAIPGKIANPTLRKMLSPGFAEESQVMPLDEWQERQMMLSREGR